MPAGKKGSESIGWRLATQESTTSFRCTEEAEFSLPARHGNAEAKGEPRTAPSGV